MVTSNTLEHFSNPDKIMKQLLSHTNKIFMMLVPYEEMELYQEHLFSFQKSFFKRNVNDFELIYLKSIDLSCSFNTMWLGKQVLAIYKAKNFVIDFAEDIEDIHIEKLTFINKINYKINLQLKINKKHLNIYCIYNHNYFIYNIPYLLIEI
jgi:hypothetical protein